MQLCATCGNEIADAVRQCPFCNHGVPVAHGRARRAAVDTVVTINLKQGLPTVDEALARLDRELATARAHGSRVVRVIHGWGSSGVGGAIRTAVRHHLRTAIRQRHARSFVPGDDYSDATDQGQALLHECPALRAELRTDRHNPGVTLVEL